MNPTQHFSQVNGIALCWFEWGQASDDPSVAGQETILLLHATGFHARCWDQVVKHLPNRHIIAVDLRGHGRSDHLVCSDWSVFCADVRGLIEQLDLRDFIAVGHSMGGHLLVLLGAAMDERIKHLLLLDPVTLPPTVYEQQPDLLSHWLDENGAHPVSKRRNHFDNAAALYQNLHGRGSYASWQDEVLKDYCDFGVLPNPDGTGVILACPPQVEASIYSTNLSANPYTKIKNIRSPVSIIRAKYVEKRTGVMDFTLSPTWPELVNHLPNATDHYFPEKTHFIPMDDPEFVAGLIKQLT